MTPKDRAFLMNGLIECSASNERKSKFMLNAENMQRLYEIRKSVNGVQMDMEIDKLKKGLNL